MPAAPRNRTSTRKRRSTAARNANTARRGAAVAVIKTNAKHGYEDADVELFSSDGVRFRVHSYRLQGASPKFRLLLARDIPDRNIIRFTNTDCEAEEDIEFVLDMLYTSLVPAPTYLSFKNAIEFAQRHEVETVINLIRQAISSRVQIPSDKDQFDHFLLALQLHDGPLAAAAFKPRPHVDFWEKEPEAIVDNHGQPLNLPGQNVFDFGAADYQAFCEIPQRALWIMLRARCLADGPGRGICKNEKEFAIHLERLMRIYYDPNQPVALRPRWFFEVVL